MRIKDKQDVDISGTITIYVHEPLPFFMTPRLAATRALTLLLRDGRSLTDALDAFLPRLGGPRERALARALAYGVVRDVFRLQALLGELLERPLREKDRDVEAALLTGLHQILAMRVPDHAAVDETVRLATALKKPWARGLINGVLRQFLRRREALLKAVARRPEVITGHPRWLRERLLADWPAEHEAIMAANLARPPMTLRVDASRLTRDEYREQLADAGLDARPAPHAPHGLVLAEPVDVAELPGFDRGLVSVQDAAAQQAALLLAPQPGERVLDACAAPGGKTLHLLEVQPRLGELVALDADANRLERVRENLARAGRQATCLAGDAARPGDWWDGQPFDRILLDAPCSASGVIRRHPDIRLLRRPGDIAQLATTQAYLLDALWPLLRPGGILLYATCSVFHEENDRRIERFLAAHPEARAHALDAAWGRACGPGRQILPGEDDMDGFYYACLAKPHDRP